MSSFWSQRSAGTEARIPSSGPDQRNGGSAAASEPSPGEYHGRPRAVRGLPHELGDDWAWDERVAREARHQETIEWLDRAAAVRGDLPPAYRARRARWARAAAVRPRAAGGDWKRSLTRGYEGAVGR